jgi:oxygen-independent coproporphyrinogen-3 oxidase
MIKLLLIQVKTPCGGTGTMDPMTATTNSQSRAVPSLSSVLDLDLVRRFDKLGPRYTSYPTADRFIEAVGGEAHGKALRGRTLGGIQQPLSLYVHLPFCASPCFYCACNKVITRDRSRATRYLQYLSTEMALQAAQMGGERRVSRMHWGGGTPTYLDAHELKVLVDMIRDAFTLDPDGEYAIEIDPRTASNETIAVLAELGFNRTSFGVQDFDPVVQKAVNRLQSFEMTRDRIEASRAANFKSVNVDLIYGLPKQTLPRFTETLEQVISLRPDRIALYSYAHLPDRFKPQRRIIEVELPSASEKLAILARAIERFEQAGYVYIGMDHFALPDDELARAQRMGNLIRNFQGYSVGPDGDILGIGVSSISKVGATYSQNEREMGDYYDALDRNRLPIARGFEMSADDMLRRSVIMVLMCQFEISMESISSAWLIDFKSKFAAELAELGEYVAMGLVTISDDTIAVTPRGRFFVRAIASTFDRYLREDRSRAAYSRII